MMRQNHVLDQDAQALWKRRKLLNLLAQHALRDRNMPDHLAFQRVVKARLPAQLAHLADVVEDRAGDQQVSVDLRVERRRGQTHPHQGQHMLEQAANPGMMQHLGRRRRTKRRPNLRIIQKRQHQPLQVEILEMSHDRAQIRVHLLDRKARNRLKICCVHFCFSGSAHARQRDLPAILVLRDLALHLDVTTRAAGRKYVRKLFPHARFERPGLVAQGQREILAVSSFSFAQHDPRETEEGGNLRVLKTRSVGHVESFHAASAYQEPLVKTRLILPRVRAAAVLRPERLRPDRLRLEPWCWEACPPWEPASDWPSVRQSVQRPALRQACPQAAAWEHP